MLRPFARPVPLALALAVATFIPVTIALVRSVQVPLGLWSEDSARLAVAPLAWGLHAAAGATFGLAGPVQFIRALRGRFGRGHRVAGWLFLTAGLGLGLTGLVMLAQVEAPSTPVISAARGLFGAALIVALWRAVAAIRVGDLVRHRAWAIRAYGIGMGSGTVALPFLPFVLVTGRPPLGLAADLVFVLWWAANIALADAIARRLSNPARVRA
ncbi:MAG: DUF2306 domain-containing protein [Tabrizicola sp.]